MYFLGPEIGKPVRPMGNEINTTPMKIPFGKHSGFPVDQLLDPFFCNPVTPGEEPSPNIQRWKMVVWWNSRARWNVKHARKGGC
jgi:hypothetical protein